MSDKAPKAGEGIKIVCDNRKAGHNYYLEDRTEAGIVLKGTEVKSLRAGKAHLNDAYAIFKGKELFLLNAHIAPYDQGHRDNHDPLRTRKLLLNRSEINKIWTRIEVDGYNLIPTKIYFKKGRAKIEMALGKSKKAHDKRAATKEKESKRDLDRMKRRLR